MCFVRIYVFVIFDSLFEGKVIVSIHRVRSNVVLIFDIL